MGAIRTWITIGIGSLARKGVKKLQLPIGSISRIELQRFTIRKIILKSLYGPVIEYLL